MGAGGFFVSTAYVATGASFGTAGLPKMENVVSFFLVGAQEAGRGWWGRHGGGLGRGRRGLDGGFDGDLGLGRDGVAVGRGGLSVGSASPEKGQM